MRPLLLALLLAATPAFAADSVDRERVSTEMTNLAQRNVWVGVERAYQDLLKMKVPLTAEEHLLGAQAARAAGDVALLIPRLEAAAAAGSAEAQTWLSDVQATYGRALVRPKGGPVGLAAVERPFNPDQGLAIDFAAAQVARGRIFDGWLPAGEYRAGLDPFTVRTGEPVEVTVAASTAEGAVPLPDLPAPQASPLRVPLFVGAGASALAGGALFLAAASRADAYRSTPLTIRDLDELQHQTNTLATASVAAFGLAAGLGAAGFAITVER